MSVMEKYYLDNDIKVFYVTAGSFPDGVRAAWEKLHSLFAAPLERKYFGISYPDKEGKIIYKAATEERYEGEAEKHRYETFIIKRGHYSSVLIRDFMKELPAIGKTFQELIADPGIDPQGACVEEYLNSKDVRCMVRQKDDPFHSKDPGKVKLHFRVDVNAPKEKVWAVLWNDSSYGKWTAAFGKGSYAESDWKEGSKILFRTPKGEGMYSKSDRKISGEYMSFQHLGVVKNGKEQPGNVETKKWSGAMENYTLRNKNGGTELTVDFESIEEYRDYFNSTFPRALEILKELSES